MKLKSGEGHAMLCGWWCGLVAGFGLRSSQMTRCAACRHVQHLAQTLNSDPQAKCRLSCYRAYSQGQRQATYGLPIILVSSMLACVYVLCWLLWVLWYHVRAH